MHGQKMICYMLLRDIDGLHEYSQFVHSGGIENAFLQLYGLNFAASFVLRGGNHRGHSYFKRVGGIYNALGHD
jgi:hypothetical protein